MRNQMETSVKTQVKIFPNFTSMPFDYGLANIMGDELRSQSWNFDILILDRIDRDLHSVKSLQLKFGLSSEFQDFYTCNNPSLCALSSV